jgi:Contractile injection system tape measure protein
MPQRHLIRRQIVEVTVADQATARHIIPLVSDLINNRVARLLEPLLDAAAGPDETRRIDRLELDLGVLNAGSLAEQLPALIAAALPGALARAGAAVAAGTAAPSAGPPAARSGGAAADALLLISQFARTGALPWWSDTRRRRVIDQSVEQASRASPAALAQTIRALAGHDAALGRLIMQSSDRSLLLVLAALAPAAEHVPLGLIDLLAATPALGVLTPARRRLIAWQALLRAARADSGPMLIETALTAIAVSLGITLALLLADLRAAVEDSSGQPDLASAVRALAERHRLPVNVARTTAQPDELLARLAQHSELAALLSRSVPMLARLPDHGRAEWAAALAGLASMPDAPTAAGLAALLRPFIRAGLISLSDLHDVLAPLARAEAAAAIAADSKPGPGEDEDSRAVTTAGLCLVWPFLPRFFARLKLLNDGESAFAGEAERHRAVLLLHHVATGERDAADFALALPKVLSGLPPHAPHHGIEPITDTEAGEARQLLEAVIAHAGCLGDISPDGFRASFLNRDGLLTTRDGAWLLRVERQTADVLLDRLPWTTQWVRQPWMQAAMRVEW